MATRLPSLKALKAFEALARHRSLTRAAEELNVTPAAVSHQVKALEADLGLSLIRRVGGEYRLLASAESGLPLLQDGFAQIAEAVRRMRRDDAARYLTISVGPTFASTWLVRRLGRFKEAHPEIEVRLDTTDAMADFSRDAVDVAIRFGAGVYPGLEARRLFDEEVYPVCSSKLLESGPPLETPADLAQHTLIHVAWALHNESTTEWETWLRAAGVDHLVDASQGPRFSHSNIALQVAMEGQGVALGSDSVASDDLKAGRLVCPFDIVLPIAFAYYLVYPEGTGEVPKIVAFRDWILGETEASRPDGQSPS
ncbi:MAG: transcriptional regulator GcvA [Kiloniellales bacterium]|nr:transcriptional regulator GcvA [Kiloniellales bacterium]